MGSINPDFRNKIINEMEVEFQISDLKPILDKNKNKILPDIIL